MRTYNETAIIEYHTTVLQPDTKVRINFLVSNEFENEINRVSKKLGLSKSVFIRTLIKNYIESQK